MQEDDGEIRCLCGYSEDDGYTIQCESCLTWQHMACVGLTASLVPETYSCSRCRSTRGSLAGSGQRVSGEVQPLATVLGELYARHATAFAAIPDCLCGPGRVASLLVARRDFSGDSARVVVLDSTGVVQWPHPAAFTVDAVRSHLDSASDYHQNNARNTHSIRFLGLFASTPIPQNSLVAMLIGEFVPASSILHADAAPRDRGFEPVDDSHSHSHSSHNNNNITILPPFVFAIPSLPSVVLDARVVGAMDGRFARFSCSDKFPPNAVLALTAAVSLPPYTSLASASSSASRSLSSASLSKAELSSTLNSINTSINLNSDMPATLNISTLNNNSATNADPVARLRLGIFTTRPVSQDEEFIVANPYPNILGFPCACTPGKPSCVVAKTLAKRRAYLIDVPPKDLSFLDAVWEKELKHLDATSPPYAGLHVGIPVPHLASILRASKRANSMSSSTSPSEPAKKKRRKTDESVLLNSASSKPTKTKQKSKRRIIEFSETSSELDNDENDLDDEDQHDLRRSDMSGHGYRADTLDPLRTYSQTSIKPSEKHATREDHITSALLATEQKEPSSSSSLFPYFDPHSKKNWLRKWNSGVTSNLNTNNLQNSGGGGGGDHSALSSPGDVDPADGVSSFLPLSTTREVSHGSSFGLPKSPLRLAALSPTAQIRPQPQSPASALLPPLGQSKLQDHQSLEVVSQPLQPAPLATEPTAPEPAVSPPRPVRKISLREFRKRRATTSSSNLTTAKLAPDGDAPATGPTDGPDDELSPRPPPPFSAQSSTTSFFSDAAFSLGSIGSLASLELLPPHTPALPTTTIVEDVSPSSTLIAINPPPALASLPLNTSTVSDTTHPPLPPKSLSTSTLSPGARTSSPDRLKTGSVLSSQFLESPSHKLVLDPGSKLHTPPNPTVAVAVAATVMAIDSKTPPSPIQWGEALKRIDPDPEIPPKTPSPSRNSS